MLSSSQKDQTLPIELLTYIIELGWRQPLRAKERIHYIQSLSRVNRSFYTILRTIRLQDAWIISPAQARMFISEIKEDRPSTSNHPLTRRLQPPRDLCKSITFHIERKEQNQPPSARFTKLYFSIIHFIVHHSLLPNLGVVVLFHLGFTHFDALSHILITDMRIPRDATFPVDVFWNFTKEQEQATKALLEKQGFNFTVSNWQTIANRELESRLPAGSQIALISKSEQRLRDELVFYLTSSKHIRLQKRNDAQTKSSGRYSEAVVITETVDVPCHLQPITPYEDLICIFDLFGHRSEDLEVDGVYGELWKEESINWDEYEGSDVDELDDMF
ncbi:hypothetical protein CVT24_004704 [Panaeolus cyanescens]|uniref:Uncharacterized protein n=1 Tax=Panaeolus cyanescens TaxID=181874 RepID=A0A409YSP8_9AGAR|nr:hypothetical protein CVT24_004704 [Panaeolus cyanescens]